MPRLKKGPEPEDRITLELRPSLEPKGYYIVHVSVDGQDLLSIWCDRIAVFPGKPPMYSLSVRGIDICGISTKMMTVRASVLDAISGNALVALGKYVKVEDDDGRKPRDVRPAADQP